MSCGCAYKRPMCTVHEARSIITVTGRTQGMSYGLIPLGTRGATRVGHSSAVLVLIDSGRASRYDMIETPLTRYVCLHPKDGAPTRPCVGTAGLFTSLVNSGRMQTSLLMMHVSSVLVRCMSAIMRRWEGSDRRWAAQACDVKSLAQQVRTRVDGRTMAFRWRTRR